MSDQLFAVETLADRLTEFSSPSDTITAFANKNIASDLDTNVRSRFGSMHGLARIQRALDISKKDGIAVETGLEAEHSPAALADLPIEPERQDEKVLLLALIRQMGQEGFECAYDRHRNLTQDTAKAAGALFDALLPIHQTPRITPDGEGGLLAVWDDEKSPTLLVVDNWRLHLVVGATTPQAVYYDDVPFDGERVPDIVIQSIPS